MRSAQLIAVLAMGATVFNGQLRLREMRVSPFFCVGQLLGYLIQNMKTETVLSFAHSNQKGYLRLGSGSNAGKKQMWSDCDTRTRALLESTGFYTRLKEINLGNSNLAPSFEDPILDHATKHRSIAKIREMPHKWRGSIRRQIPGKTSATRRSQALPQAL